jgi:protocatechuate 4,5-dioxygenase alpha subunit
MRAEYSGIPGTTVFDGEQSRRGYQLNQFCMSLLNPANRDRFKADEEAYPSEWNLTERQKSAVLRRDYNAMSAEGGNIFFLGKIGAKDGKSFVQLAASMTGMTAESYTAMMVGGGRARRVPCRNRPTQRKVACYGAGNVGKACLTATTITVVGSLPSTVKRCFRSGSTLTRARPLTR